VLANLSDKDKSEIVNLFVYDDLDQDGLVGALDPDPATPDVTTPEITDFKPVSDQILVAGEHLTFSAHVYQAVGLATVELLADGNLVDTVTVHDGYVSAPVTVPATGTMSLTIRAASDTGGNKEVTLTYTVSSDPGATVNGRVLDSAGNPVEGVTVSIGTHETTTGPQGLYSLSPIATLGDAVRVHAETRFGAETVTADSNEFVPTHGDTIDMGDLTLGAVGLKPVGAIPEAERTFVGEVKLPHVLTSGSLT
jgi:hypothetical protein